MKTVSKLLSMSDGSLDPNTRCKDDIQRCKDMDDGATFQKAHRDVGKNEKGGE